MTRDSSLMWLTGVVTVAAVVVLVLVFAWWRWSRTSSEKGCTVLRVEHDAESGASVEIVDPACQEGLPHTTDSHTIRMTETVWNSTRRNAVLIHERIHLDQKRQPQEWEAFYKREWGYTVSATPPVSLPNQLRPNPDTAAKPWALWRSRWLFFPEAAGALKDAPVRVWDTHHAVESSPPPEWIAFFCGSHGCPHQYEHPHEISAEMITGGDDSDAATRLFTWRNSRL